jgi:pilus assembly protein Flp/PilA
MKGEHHMFLKLYTTAVSKLAHLKSKKGQTLVEYALILALVSIVVITVLITLSGHIQNVFNKISNTLSTV